MTNSSPSASRYAMKILPASRVARNGFQWPESGRVVCPDWDPNPECGNGLHLFLNGVGDVGASGWRGEQDGSFVFQIIEIPADANIVDIEGNKIKVDFCDVLKTGMQSEITSELYRLSKAQGIIGLCLQSTDKLDVIGGDYSTLTGGDCSTLIAGHWSKLTGGKWSTLTARDRSTLIGGYGSTLTGGKWSTLTAGGYSSLTGGHWSTLTGGDESILTGGYRSTLSGGDDSTLTWRYWNGMRIRTHIEYVGENGILPNTPYEGGWNGSQFIVVKVESAV